VIQGSIFFVAQSITNLSIGKLKNKIVALPFTLKSKYLKAKEEELWKLKYFTMQKYNKSSKKSSKRNQNPSRYYNSITNLKFQLKPKYHLSKILI